jgi:drug/metabolite transporter (DMT)-like permease
MNLGQFKFIFLRRGYLYVVSAAVLWGGGGSFSKFLFNGGITPYQLVQLRISIAAGTLFLWLLTRRPKLLIIESKMDGSVLCGLVCRGGLEYSPTAL